MKHKLSRVLAAVAALTGLLGLAACGNTASGTGTASSQASKYVSISQDEAKQIMDSEENVIILDVRTQEEYDEGHIENAILIPHDEIDARAESELPDKEQTILVYCRSGNRSKTAAQSLADLGYTNVKEFGGIKTWEYGTVQE